MKHRSHENHAVKAVGTASVREEARGGAATHLDRRLSASYRAKKPNYLIGRGQRCKEP